MTDALAAFFADEALALDGRTFDGAPYGREGGRVETHPRPEAPTATEWVAILDAGECTLFASQTPPHRVVLDDLTTTVVARLSDLEPALLPKLRRVEKLAERALTLIQDKQHQAALDLLQPAVRAIELSFVDHATWLTFHQTKVFAHARNLYAVCLSHLGREDEAEAIWRRASQSNAAASRNLADRYLEMGRDDELRELYGSQRRVFERTTLTYLATACAIAAARAGRDDELAALHDALRELPRDEVVDALLAKHPGEAARVSVV